MRTVRDLEFTGMLWFLNQVVFLPRGWEFCIVLGHEGEVGWDLVRRPDLDELGTEPSAKTDEKFEALFAELCARV